MLLVIVHHHCKPGMVDRAIARIDGNGDRMIRMKGFVFRHRTISKDDDHAICTVTAWWDEAAYENWSRQPSPAGSQEDTPYVRVVNELHFVQRSQAAP